MFSVSSQVLSSEFDPGDVNNEDDDKTTTSTTTGDDDNDDGDGPDHNQV